MNYMMMKLLGWELVIKFKQHPVQEINLFGRQTRRVQTEIENLLISRTSV
jgi:hypothetical protein